SRIVVVLVLGGLARLRFNEKCSFKALATGIVARTMQHPGKMFLLALHIGIEQGHVSLTAAPEYVVFTAKGDGRIQRRLDLSTGVRHCSEIGVGGRAIHVAFVGKEVCRAPQQFYATG